jgi:hypothetical protein
MGWLERMMVNKLQESFFNNNRKEKILMIFISVIVSAIISAILAYIIFNIQFITTTNLEKKNIANGFLSDVKMSEYHLLRVENSFNDFNNPESPNHNQLIYFAYSIYPPYGLFNSNKQDIYKLDPILSNKLFDFYYNMTLLEEERNTILFIDSIKEADNGVETKQEIFDDIGLRYIVTLGQSKELERELQEYIESL